jgi:hypothetical protein
MIGIVGYFPETKHFGSVYVSMILRMEVENQALTVEAKQVTNFG